MRQLRYFATTLTVCVGLMIPVGGFSQNRGTRSERNTTNNAHRGGANSQRTQSNGGGSFNVTTNNNRGKATGNTGKVDKNIKGNPGNVSQRQSDGKGNLGNRNLNRGSVQNNPRPVAPVKPIPKYERRPEIRPNVGYRPKFAPNHYAGWGRPLPPPPPRPARRYFSRAPLIDFGLGLVYGSLLNAGVNTFINAGLNVAATVNNAIYLNDVIRYGISWPQVTMFYDSGRLSGARYHYGSPYTNNGVYDNVYVQLVQAYGMPINVTNNGVSRSATWWGGGNSGYVTLSVAPGYDDYGNAIYYTDLLYGK